MAHSPTPSRVSTAGDTFLGGEDFDLRLIDYGCGSGVLAIAAGLVTSDVEFSGVTATSWVTLVALGLGSTFLPFFATLFASRHTTAARVALTGYLAPVVGVVAGVVLLDEVLTVPIVVGATLALAGIVMVGRGRRARRPAATAS